MDEFCAKLADILEVNEVKPSDVMEDFPEWDSLSVLSVISMIGSDYNRSAPAPHMQGTKTPRSLWGFSKAERTESE